MTDPDWEAYVETVAPVMGLTIDAEWKPAVAAWVRTAATAAALFVDLPLDHAVDQPAPVFRPGTWRTDRRDGSADRSADEEPGA